jgi:phage-related minor tail protein
VASKTLKGLTIEIGGDTSGLDKALGDVEKRSRSLSSELGHINRALKLNPNSTELLAQKQKVLADAISSTEEKLNILREAEKQVQAQFERGEVSQEQVRALRREIINTEGKLDGYKKAAKETADAVDNLGDESGKTAEEIEKEKRAAEEAGKAIDDMGARAGEAAKTGVKTLAGVAAGLLGTLVGIAESSREYRTETGKLSTAYADAGHSNEVATRTYKELQSVLGDTGQAVEASNMLAKLCKDQKDLSTWTNILTGVYGTFGTSLPVEGLAEAANETAKVGQVTGPLADALNWAADASEDFGVSMKEATEENEEWNKRVKEATTAEDKFNLALEQCADEQERQKLITETLTGLYAEAAKKYQTTNKEVIEANKANEKWNETVSKIGKHVEPVMTDIKEMGVTVLEYAEKPLKSAADFIRKKALPAIKDLGGWVKNNGPTIKAVLIGLGAAMVTYKVATIASTAASKGYTVATLAAAAAQKVLNAVMAAGPWGLAATLIMGAATAIAVLCVNSKETAKPIDVLTEKEKDLMEAADKAADAFRDQKEATEEALKNDSAKLDYVMGLKDELLLMADASGKISEKDRARADFIKNELGSLAGIEIEIIDGQIQKYDELRETIDDVILSKTANAMLEHANENYLTAIEKEDEALNNLNLKAKELEEARRLKNEALTAYYAAQKSGGRFSVEIGEAKEAYETQNAAFEAKQAEYDKAEQSYIDMVETIERYSMALTAATQGDYQTTIDLLGKKGEVYSVFSDKVDAETNKVLHTLHSEAIHAGAKAKLMRSQFEQGIGGYTEKMVLEAEEGAEKARQAFANAYADAELIGEDLGNGIEIGMEHKRAAVYAMGYSLVGSALDGMDDRARRNSPAKETIDFGEDVGEGAEIGIDNKTPDVKRAASRQASAILDAYSAQELAGQKALRSVAEQQVVHQTAGQMSAATANAPMLEKILTAIEKGQVLLLDGDAVVGGTANRMDRELGLLRDLAAKGAL